MRRTCLWLLLALLSHGALSTPVSWIRVNQLGYIPHARKIAVLVSKDSALSVREFSVRELLLDRIVFRAKASRPFGPYGAFRQSFRLDFSRLTAEGRYVVECGGVVSPSFRIAPDVYDGTADFLLRYLRQQRSGFNPFLKD